MEFISVPIRVLICYMIGEIYKVVFKKNTKSYKIIPILVALVGGGLGIIIYYTSPEVIFNATNMWNAMLIGIVSGFTATGTNQVIKQILNKKELERKNEKK